MVYVCIGPRCELSRLQKGYRGHASARKRLGALLLVPRPWSSAASGCTLRNVYVAL